MKLHKEEFLVKSEEGKTTYIDITKEVEAAIKKSEIYEGIVVVISPHTTCSVFFEEFTPDKDKNGDEFLQIDLNNVLDKIVPPHNNADTYNYPGEKHYENVESWPNAEEYLPDGDRSALWNGDAHLKSTIIGSSETFEVVNNQIGVGATGYIYFADFDKTRSRERKCKVVIIGE